MSQPIRFTRRRFLQTSALATATWSLGACSYSRVAGANDRLNIAHVGTAGIATGQHIGEFHKLGVDCTCYCDADSRRFKAAAETYPGGKGYTDYRQMFDKHMNEIDAVSVAAPDHHHYPATIIAMMQGKHAYTQKPLTHTMWEARQLKLATKKYKLATQMGNQMHANEGNRRIVEWIRSGKLGTIKEAHIWTNRPVWRQGNAASRASAKKAAELNWDAWLGPAPARPFVDGYHPFHWRGAQDYGTGALGDMGCHTTDGFFWGMDADYPTAAELIEGEAVGGLEQFDKQAAVKFEYPAKGDRPGFNYFWYEGGKKPAKPAFATKGLTQAGELSKSGGFIIGDKGAIQYMDDYGNRIAVYLFEDNRQFDSAVEADVAEMEKLVPKTIQRSEGHHLEFVLACKGEKPYDYPKSNFAYAAKLTESVLLGTVAQKVGGRIEFDAENQKITNNPIADALITKEYRRGWEFRMG